MTKRKSDVVSLSAVEKVQCGNSLIIDCCSAVGWLLFLMVTTLPVSSFAQNPIIQTIYTADPAVMVYKDTLFLYTGHDEDKANWFLMKDWHVYSTTDMVNWTDRGVGLSLKNFNWANKDAWAGQCIERNGKFYWYVPMNQANGKGMAIGVAISDHPTGPFTDAMKKILVTTGWGDIDPAVFIDDDGKAYLYWGNPTLYYVKLNEDMISYDQQVGVVRVPLTEESFKLRVINAHETFAWASAIDGTASHSVKNDANNKYYWYVSAIDKATGKQVIGVGVGEKAIGPFTDVLGKPLVSEQVKGEYLNPTVVYDDDKEPYLTWFNKNILYVKLNRNMVSYDQQTGIQQVSADRKSWFAGKIKRAEYSNGKRVTTYEEGPWLYKRSGLYYLLYPAGGIPEHLAYSTSTSPTGPWMYRDTIMEVIRNEGAFTNHPALIEYKDHTYLFYHNGGLPGGDGFHRSVCVDEVQFRADGSISCVKPTKGAVKSVGTLNPYSQVEAETIAWEVGIETVHGADGSIYVTDISNGDYIKVRSVNFGKGPKNFRSNVAAIDGGSIEVHIDSLNGPLLTSCEVNGTGTQQNWTTVTSNSKKFSGIHDIYLLFKGGDGNLFNFDWWKFETKKLTESID